MTTSSHLDQSDDNVYVDPDAINKIIYAEPTRKSKTSKVKPINDPKGSIKELTTHQIYNEPTYASVQNEPTYANQNSNDKSLKDPDSSQNKKENNSNDIAYAVIYHKNDSINFNPSKMPVYSVIVPQKSTENNEYVNGNEEIYVEPAYCEVIKPEP